MNFCLSEHMHFFILLHKKKLIVKLTFPFENTHTQNIITFINI